jgi:hypothetical protein
VQRAAPDKTANILFKFGLCVLGSSPRWESWRRPRIKRRRLQHAWLGPWRRRPEKTGDTFGIGSQHPGWAEPRSTATRPPIYLRGSVSPLDHHKCAAGPRSETSKHSRFRRTIIGAVPLMMAGTIIAGLLPLSVRGANFSIANAANRSLPTVISSCPPGRAPTHTRITTPNITHTGPTAIYEDEDEDEAGSWGYPWG